MWVSGCSRELFHFATLLLQLPFCYLLSALRAHPLRSSWQGATLPGQVIVSGPMLPAIENMSSMGVVKILVWSYCTQGSTSDLTARIWMWTSVCFYTQSLLWDSKCPQSLLLSNLACFKNWGVIYWLEPRMDLWGSKHLALVFQSNRKFWNMESQIKNV